MLNILFWNLSGNENSEILSGIIAENAIDILILSEYSGMNFQSLLSGLGNDYCLHEGFGACDKIVLMSRKEIDIVVRREQDRYVLYSFNAYDVTYIIAGIHLPSNPYANTEQRKHDIRHLVHDICELETKLKCDKTIVIGDFNSSPFDDELVQKDTFNSVLYKDLIVKSEYVTISGKRYRRFYNPMVNYISEDSKNYGSLYYASGMNSLYWFCYDQVIVRKPLIHALAEVMYCKTVNRHSLLSNFKPNKRISDHLPLLVKFEGMM